MTKREKLEEILKYIQDKTEDIIKDNTGLKKKIKEYLKIRKCRIQTCGKEFMRKNRNGGYCSAKCKKKGYHARFKRYYSKSKVKNEI